MFLFFFIAFLFLFNILKEKSDKLYDNVKNTGIDKNMKPKSWIEKNKINAEIVIKIILLCI